LDFNVRQKRIPWFLLCLLFLNRKARLTLNAVKRFVIVVMGGLCFSQLSAQELVTSNTCAQCHSSDGHVLMMSGEDVSPIQGWKASVMAFASQDPYWLAKMAAEVADRPSMKGEIEAECLTCHAPVATAKALNEGQKYTREKLEQDALGLDGVSCLSCHRIAPDGLGTKAGMSGHFQWAKDEAVYGPYQNPLQRPMWMHTGFVPQYGAHIESASLCASCHNLYTPVLDDDNQVVGQFAEQTVFSEWAASDYAEVGETCQSCHMPGLANNSRIALMPPFAPVRKTVWNHRIVGGNTFLLSLLKYKRDAFQVSREEFDFERTIEETRTFLETAVEMDLEVNTSGDSVDVVIRLTNLTGHKFPTGYPERRAWLHVWVEDQAGHIVFESGAVDTLGQIAMDQDIMPHFDLITAPDQVQIYEMIPGDLQGRRTRRILRASTKLKDNRLLPSGFHDTMDEFSEDVKVVGKALEDGNFDGGEGGDRVTYRFYHEGHRPLRVYGELLYQPVPPQAIRDLESFEGVDVSQFLHLTRVAKPPMQEVIGSVSATIN